MKASWCRLTDGLWVWSATANDHTVEWITDDPNLACKGPPFADERRWGVALVNAQTGEWVASRYSFH
jgi:hypothetical protein